jgi:septation ring formation regulator EzrA
MSPLIITIIIALATFIISIFGASWLNQQAMNKRIDDLRSYLDARFDAVDARFDAVDARFAALEPRFAAIEQRLDRIERQLETIFKPSLPSR